METLIGKHVLVTGAAGGIGSSLVKLLTASGARVFLAARNEDKLKRVAEANRVPAGQTFAVDLSNPAGVLQLKSKYFETFPVIDILVNAAGSGIIKPIE